MLLWLVGFFVLVFAVNAVMVRAAISTFGGVETTSSYKAGLQFEHEVAVAERQDALHWQVSGKLTRNAAGEAVLDVTARDAKGAPLAGLRADARLAHPADERLDHVVALRRSAPAIFTAQAAAQPGQWDLIVDLYRGDKRLFRSRSRVTLEVNPMEEALDLSLFATPAGDGTLGMDLAVDGIACGGCIARIEGAVKRLPGVTEARLNFTNRRLHVAWSDGALAPAQILQTLESIGYHGHPFRPLRAEQEEAAEMRLLTRSLAVAAFAAMNVMLLSVSVWSGNATDITPETRDFFHWASALIALPAAAYAGRPFFKSAWRALRSGALNMDVPISLGVILALAMSVVETAHHAKDAYYDSAIMLLLFLLVGRTLDHAMRRKTRAVAGNLAALKAETAHRFMGDELVSVPVAALQGRRPSAGQARRAGAGRRRVLGGVSELDESLITGETARRKVGAGATVYAGSMNYSGALTLRVTAADRATLLDEIERLLEKAASAKSRTMRLADRAARFYAPMVHATAALTFLGWWLAGASLHDAVVTAIAVLIITCPCALALAIPAVQVVASGALFRSGVILNAGDAIERLGEADTVIFDKTGTLTLPEPRVADVAAIDPELLQLAARLALSSRHPLAVALAREGASHIAL